MASLRKHLTTSGPHACLPFHPACPICAETRLHGKPPEGPVVPAKMKASLATALVTLSATATPAASIAQEADQEMEGIELPQSERDDGSDPGGETGVPGEEVVPAPDTGGGDEGDDSDEPALQSEPDVDPLRPPPPDEPSEGPGPTTAPPSGGTPVSPGDPVTSPPETIVRNHAPAPARGNDERAVHPSADKPKAKPRSGVGSAPAANVPPAPPLAGPSELDAPPRSDPPVPGDDSANGTHVVQPGESLWSIAAGLAGDDATPAKIARIVNRLWNLNADRIGTGDPDLVMAGTTLRLR